MKKCHGRGGRGEKKGREKEWSCVNLENRSMPHDRERETDLEIIAIEFPYLMQNNEEQDKCDLM